MAPFIVLLNFININRFSKFSSSLEDRQYGALTTHVLVDMLHHWHAASSISPRRLNT